MLSSPSSPSYPNLPSISTISSHNFSSSSAPNIISPSVNSLNTPPLTELTITSKVQQQQQSAPSVKGRTNSFFSDPSCDGNIGESLAEADTEGLKAALSHSSSLSLSSLPPTFIPQTGDRSSQSAPTSPTKAGAEEIDLRQIVAEVFSGTSPITSKLNLLTAGLQNESLIYTSDQEREDEEREKGKVDESLDERSESNRSEESTPGLLLPSPPQLPSVLSLESSVSTGIPPSLPLVMTPTAPPRPPFMTSVHHVATTRTHTTAIPQPNTNTSGQTLTPPFIGKRTNSAQLMGKDAGSSISSGSPVALPSLTPFSTASGPLPSSITVPKLSIPKPSASQNNTFDPPPSTLELYREGYLYVKLFAPLSVPRARASSFPLEEGESPSSHTANISKSSHIISTPPTPSATSAGGSPSYSSRTLR
eukprot:TRINITY_DN3255_c0_g1_i1.p1 TRINITY_DN3255_c0_g1~~TRINITY_DN3255_c0_g1_i1.p1  ORF type:complete len:420 (+),score=69.19 TRINITY_DN3255_c0_g1_i1:422-1681(+)